MGGDVVEVAAAAGLAEGADCVAAELGSGGGTTAGTAPVLAMADAEDLCVAPEGHGAGSSL
ncbi:hypothetical protein [Streptomyces sp. NPDC002587]